MTYKIKTIVVIDSGLQEDPLLIEAEEDDTIGTLISRLCDILEQEEEEWKAWYLRAFLTEGRICNRGSYVSEHHSISELPWHSFLSEDGEGKGCIVNLYVIQERGSVKCSCPCCGGVVYTDQPSCDYCDSELEVSEMEQY